MTNCERSSEDAMDPEEFSPEERAWMGIGQSRWYSYICGECGVKTEVEDIVAGSFMVLACPQCGGAMQEIDENCPPEGR
jgi:DNA-directed RNA polymerase subunit RPC12/RpoP